MKKNTKILVGVGLAAAVFLLYKKSYKNFTNNETVKDLGKEIKSVSEPVQVEGMPRFGRPVNIMPPKNTKPIFMGFIDGVPYK
jgi:hypothetical protein